MADKSGIQIAYSIMDNLRSEGGKEAPEEKKAACTFIKPRKIRGNIRKKESDYSAVEDESETSVVKKQKTNIGGLVASTKSEKKEKEDLTYQSLGATMLGDKDYLAFAAIETETEKGNDEVARRRKKTQQQKEDEVLAGEDAERADAVSKTYKGLNNYKDYLEKTEAHGLSKGAGIRAGPVRGVTHIRISARFDYQPDICKDYKETGYCGYGDSCKFLHDRGDYKAGWQLEKEWDEGQKGKKTGLNDETNYEIKEDDNIPFACAICRQGFVSPIQTKCKHYFCERCALQRFKKNMKCFICGENTYGAFSSVPARIKERMQEKYQEALEKGENLDDEDLHEHPQDQEEAQEVQEEVKA